MLETPVFEADGMRACSRTNIPTLPNTNYALDYRRAVKTKVRNVVAQVPCSVV